MQRSGKHITIKSLALMIFTAGTKDALHNPDRALWVLKMINASKKVSISSLKKVSTMLFGYLNGKKYDKSERPLLWNVDELEQELFWREEV
jgi:hypothetical protein